MENTASDERDKRLIRLLWETGMRASEICGYGNNPPQGMRVSDLIDRGREYFIRVRGKGGKVRFVPVMPDTFRRLSKYVENARPDLEIDEIWQGTRIDPRKGITVPMTPSGLGQMLQVVAGRASVDPKRTHPHNWRHSCATYLIGTKHMNLLDVKAILGHKDLRTIERYTHLSASSTYKALRTARQQQDEED